ncbi:MAG: ABC transporter permease subunit [Eubacteriales bacterium]|nr:ABC transporter permease subunit [Eubacteriales bacterium]
MSAFMAFTKKELLQLTRTSKLAIILIIFVLFGIMNPALAKITPWLMEMTAESLEASGMTIEKVVVDDMTSWTQYYKNVPMEIIVFILMFAGIFTIEYQRGTLVNMITKGLTRGTVFASKSLVLSVLWTVGYWICYGITYGYNAYFWGNTNVKYPLIGAVYYYLYGIWLISLVVLFSSFCKTSTNVLLGVGGVYVLCLFAGMIKTVGQYLPTKLTDGFNLISGITGVSDYTKALVCTLIFSVVNFVTAKILMDKVNVIASV